MGDSEDLSFSPLFDQMIDFLRSCSFILIIIRIIYLYFNLFLKFDVPLYKKPLYMHH